MDDLADIRARLDRIEAQNERILAAVLQLDVQQLPASKDTTRPATTKSTKATTTTTAKTAKTATASATSSSSGSRGKQSAAKQSPKKAAAKRAVASSTNPSLSGSSSSPRARPSPSRIPKPSFTPGSPATTSRRAFNDTQEARMKSPFSSERSSPQPTSSRRKAGLFAGKHDHGDGSAHSHSESVRFWPMKSSVYRPTAVQELLDKEGSTLKQDAKTAPPNYTLELEAVLGYRGKDMLNNIVQVGDGVCYFAAAAGVFVQELQSPKPRYSFFTGHDDDILSIAAHPEGKLVATGQLAAQPTISIWDAETREVVCVLGENGEHDRAICALAFSTSGDFLMSVGRDDNHTVLIWNWRYDPAAPVAAYRGSQDRVLVAGALRSGIFVTAGVKHIKFCAVQPPSEGQVPSTGSALIVEPKKGVFGSKLEISNVYAVCGLPRAEGFCATGGTTGEIGIWNARSGKCLTATPAHEGSVFSLCEWGDGIVSGGKDGKVRVWRFFGADENPTTGEHVTLSPIREFELHDQPWIRALCVMPNPSDDGDSGKYQIGSVIAGTSTNEVVYIDEEENQKFLTRGHTAELWGLAIMRGGPDDRHIFATSGDDQKLSLWCATMDGAFARLASTSLPAASHCCDFSPDGQSIAVGCNDGSVIVFATPPGLEFTQEISFGKPVSVVQICGQPKRPSSVSSPRITPRASSRGVYMAPNQSPRGSPRPGSSPAAAGKQDRIEASNLGIDQVRFSPDGTMLVAATHEQTLVVLTRSINVLDLEVKVPGVTIQNTRTNWVKKAVCRGHSSFVSHVDWSCDGKHIQSNSGDYEYAVWESATGRQLTRASDLRDIEWSDWTLPFGWATQGIWGDSNDGTDVNAVHKSSHEQNPFLVTGDDFTFVNLFNFPTHDAQAPHYRFGGHASHVMNVRVCADNSRVVSVGGQDCCTLIWRVQEIEPDTGETLP